MNEKKIIIIIGPICAGKGQVSELLHQQYHFSSFRFSASLEAIMFEKYGEIKREYYALVANELRVKYGSSALAKVTVDQAEKQKSKLVVIDGARNPAEVQYIKDFYKDHTCIALGLTAPQQLRFSRLQSRKRIGDPQNFETFKKIDDEELTGGQGESGIRINDCLALADIVIENAASFEELKQKIDAMLQEYNVN